MNGLCPENDLSVHIPCAGDGFLASDKCTNQAVFSYAFCRIGAWQGFRGIRKSDTFAFPPRMASAIVVLDYSIHSVAVQLRMRKL